MKKTHLTFLAIATCLLFQASFAQVKLDSGLVACYPFNGDANDFSGHNNHGIVHDATLTQDRFGNPNSAYNFNGENSYIDIQRFDSLVPTDEFSISFWCIVYNGIRAHAQFQAQPDDISDRFCISIHYYHNSVPSTFWDFGNISTGGRFDTINIPFIAQWEHYVFISSASQNVMKEYRNGILLKSENHHGTIVNKSRNLWIGKGSPLLCMDGDMDDIRFYNRAITPDEVQALHADNPSCTSTFIPELSSSDAVFIYPNPSRGSFNISFKEPIHNSSVKIINSLGENVHQIFIGDDFIQTLQIVSEKLNEGLYFVLVSNGDRQCVQKLVIDQNQ
jgi:hypothetical protein